jgi:hypothetical protein
MNETIVMINAPRPVIGFIQMAKVAYMRTVSV